MVCLATHHIGVFNLNDQETVTHSILLLSGRVTPRCGNVHNIVVEVQKVPPKGTSNQFVESQKNIYTEESVVARNGDFKLLLDLQRYENDGETNAVQLLLQCCYCHTNSSPLRIEYKPLKCNYKVQPLYIVCQGEVAKEEQQQIACRKIDLGIRLVQSVYAEKLRSAGFTRRTFRLHSACRLFHSQLKQEQAWGLNEDELWQYFANELLNTTHSWSSTGQLKFVAYIGCTRYNAAGVAATADYSYANIHRHLQAHAALGGGGLALFGSAHLYAWPEHFNEIISSILCEKKVDCAQLPDESNYRRTYGGVYASTLGALCHELGHVFDLGHTNDGVMGTGFDYINRVFTVDQLTENLPTRVIHKGALPRSELLAVRPRFTQLKQKPGSTFLDKYHEQRQGDGFYFTRNCAIILAHHNWFRETLDKFEVSVKYGDEIRYESVSHCIVSPVEPLKLVELRCNNNSLVQYFYEFSGDLHRFELPPEAVLPQTHHIFVLTASGFLKKIDFETPKQD